MDRKIKSLLIIGLTLIIFTSCTVTQNLTLEKNNQGTAKMILYADDFFQGVLQDLSPYLGTDREDELVLDNSISDLSQKIENSPATSNSDFFKADENNYLGTLDYININNLLEDLTELQNQDVFVVSNETNSLDININMDNWDEVTKIFPFMAEENFAVYGPVYNHGLESEDYLDMIGFILGEEGPGKIEESEINIIFQAPNKIISSDGEMLSDDVTAFHIPLLQLLLLNEPISLNCKW